MERTAYGLDDNNPNACHYNLRHFDGNVGAGSCKGDSGAPFYLKGTGPNVSIRGSVVLAENDSCSDNQQVWVEVWPKIVGILGVSIKTADPL